MKALIHRTHIASQKKTNVYPDWACVFLLTNQRKSQWSNLRDQVSHHPWAHEIEAHKSNARPRRLVSLECCFQWSNGHKLHQRSASPYLYKVAVNVIRGKTDIHVAKPTGFWGYWDWDHFRSVAILGCGWYIDWRNAYFESDDGSLVKPFAIICYNLASDIVL